MDQKTINQVGEAYAVVLGQPLTGQSFIYRLMAELGKPTEDLQPTILPDDKQCDLSIAFTALDRIGKLFESSTETEEIKVLKVAITAEIKVVKAVLERDQGCQACQYQIHTWK